MNLLLFLCLILIVSDVRNHKKPLLSMRLLQQRKDRIRLIMSMRKLIRFMRIIIIKNKDLFKKKKKKKKDRQRKRDRKKRRGFL
jgi:hypothetical protein